MRTIGLLGGMSWESSLEYYRLINQLVKERLGGLHSAKCILYSVDFEEIERCQREGRWDEAGRLLAGHAQTLEAAGADFLLLCTNTMHKVAEEIQRAVQIPLLHLADAAAETVKAMGMKTVGLLGTSYTMEEDFYKRRLIQSGLEVIIPEEKEREIINAVIFQELCRGEIRGESRKRYQEIMSSLVDKGAEGVILGCTEIGLLVREEDAEVPLFDTTYLHALKAVEFALSV